MNTPTHIQESARQRVCCPLRNLASRIKERIRWIARFSAQRGRRVADMLSLHLFESAVEQNVALGVITSKNVVRFVFTDEAERLIARVPRPEFWLFPDSNPQRVPKAKRCIMGIVTIQHAPTVMAAVPTTSYVLTSDKCSPCIFEWDTNTGRSFYVGEGRVPTVRRKLVGGVYV